MSETVVKASQDTQQKSENLRRKILKSFLFLSVGVVLSLSAYVGLLSLQSSLNISHSLGTTSLSVLYSSAIVANLVLAPSAYLCLGMKITLILAEICLSVYTIANVYPKFYTLLPASIIASFAESTMWYIGPMFVTKALAVLWPIDEKLRLKFCNLEDCRLHYIGLCCCIVKSVQFFGNILSYAVLYGGLLWSHSEKRNITNFSNCALLEHDIDFQYDRKNYQALNKAAVYVLIGVYLVMQFTACGVHGYFLDSNFSMQQSNDSREISTTTYLKNILRDTFTHIFTVKQALFSPLYMQYGFFLSFGADYARSFVACVLGVEKVGLAAAISGIGTIAFPYILGSTTEKFGIHVGVITTTCMQALTWLGVFLWQPNTGNLALSYIIGISLGACDGAWQVVIFGLIPIYFPSKLEIAFSIQSLWIVAGMSIGYAATSVVIVKTKLFIIIGVQFVGLLGYVCAEILRKRKSVRDEENKAILES